MEPWVPLRDVVYEHGFDAALTDLNPVRMDEVWKAVDALLGGASLAKLDTECPEIVAGTGVRIVLVASFPPDIPALRVLARFPHPDDSKAHVLGADTRD